MQTDIPGPEGQQTSIAQQLGLPESVNVLRGSGVMEGGWHPAEITQGPHPNTGEKTTFVRVDGTDAEGKGIYKRIPIGDLQSWNAPDDDDTIPIERVRALRAESSKSNGEIDQGAEVPEQVAEQIGEVAVEGSGLIEPMEPQDAGGDIADEQVEGPAAISTEQDGASREAKQTAAMKELQETWGLTEELTVEQTVELLTREAEQIDQVVKLLHDFDPIRHTASKAIMDTLHGRGIVYLGNNTKARVDKFLDGKSFGLICDFAVSDGQAVLPEKLRNSIAQRQAELSRLKSVWSAATDGFRTGRPMINSEPANQAAGMMSIDVPQLQKCFQDASRQVKDKIQDLTGRSISDQELQRASEQVMYRNPEWAERAAKLKDASVDDPELEKLVTEIEGAIRIESGMVDDPNSPRKWFGDQILANRGKGRQDTITSGRPKGTAPSQRVAAEIAADILRGNFDYSRARGDTIDLSADGQKVVLGQHRAAALAMIFGDQWIREGKKRGLQILNSY